MFVTYNHTLESLRAHIVSKRYADAWCLYIDKRKELPFWHRKLLLPVIEDGLAGRPGYRRVVAFALATVAASMLGEDFFHVQVLDFFSFLSIRFPFYNYFSAMALPVLNLLLTCGLIWQFAVRILYARQLRREPFPLLPAAAMAALILSLSFLALHTLFPLFQDLPMVMRREYLERRISHQEDYDMVYNRLILNLGDGDMSEEHGPMPWYIRKQIPGFLGIPTWMNFIYVEGEYSPMSERQFGYCPVNDQEYPIVIRYLPKSRRVLLVYTGEEPTP